MGRLFGTDGIRGIANIEITCELAMNIGRAVSLVLRKQNKDKAKVLIGKDTRLSSDMLEGALTAGLCSVGADVVILGVVPTPAVAYLVKEYQADAGIMISASHNPYEFNGIKVFCKDGYKLPDCMEDEIENILSRDSKTINYPENYKVGKVIKKDTATDDYIEHIKSTIEGDLKGLKVAFDCSNGSASRTAEKLFKSLGVKCHMLNNNPNGININKDCGSVHIGALSRFVKDNNFDLGIAFDGDADRCLAIDENGRVIDGDFIMAICAQYLKSNGRLAKDTVVGTVMTNMGFNKFCSENKLNFISTKVGDRYVLEAMLKNGYNFGGEQSGHIIFLDFATTGDGQLTAVQLLKIVKEKNKKFSEISNIMKKYPQVMLNVEVSKDGKEKFPYDKVVTDAIEDVKRRFTKNDKNSISRELIDDVTAGATGRILVRASGTEPLVRVMLEGEDENEIMTMADSVAQVIRNRLV